MTDDLHRLLHDAGDRLDVPPPRAREVIAQGRSRRRRRAAEVFGGAALAVTLTVGGTWFAVGNADQGPGPADSSDAFSGVTYAVGNQVFLDGGETTVTIDDRAVKSMYYSSAGLIVRHGKNSASDGGGPQRFTVVADDGETRRIAVETEENAHGVDTDQPYLAWTEKIRNGVEVVVYDVETDSEQARVPVDGRFSWSPPPVALSGDTVLVGGVGDRAPMYAVDWRDESVSESELVGYFPLVSGGHAVVDGSGGELVVDAETGEELFDPPGGWNRSTSLSPDGRYADVSGRHSTIYDVETGEEVPLEEQLSFSVGWTEDGRVFQIDKGRLTVCSPASGDCDSRRAELPDGGNDMVILGGTIHES